MRTIKDCRGFKSGVPFRCGYNSEIRVSESSAADKPHIWLSLSEDINVLTQPAAGHAGAHLTIPQAKKLIKQLEWMVENHYQNQNKVKG